MPKSCPIGLGCRIRRLHLCRRVRPFPNESLGYDTKQSDGDGNAGDLGNAEYPFIAIWFPGPHWFGVVAPDIYGSNRTKLRTYVKLNYLKLNGLNM